MEDDTTMAQEDQIRNCNNSGGGNVGIGGVVGRSSKKPKQKKVPQRGLGVAQLEKIRLEEQQKRDATAILSSQCSIQSPKSSYSPPLSSQNLHHSNQISSLIPLASGSATNLWSPMSLQHMMDAKVPATSTVPLANCGFEAGWHGVSPHGHKNVSKLCGSQEFDFEKERFVVEPALQFPPRLPFQPNPNWSLPSLVQRTPHYQQPSSSIVSVSSGTSSTIVPVEPPSNQNHSDNVITPVTVRPAEKIVGMKRPYPFSLDVPPTPPFNYKMVSTFTERRTNASTLFGSGSGFSFDAGSSTLREVPSCSASNSEPNSRKNNKEDENFNGDFLTLAPPAPTTPTSYPPPTPTSYTYSKLKSFSAFPAFHNHENPDFESPSSQGIIEGHDPPSPPPWYNRFNQQNQPLYCFFPPAPNEAQNGQTTARIQNGNKVEESVDLNLKL